MVKKSLIVFVFSAFFASTAAKSADPLPNTKPLTETGDLARLMVDGIHKYLDRELAAAPGKRDELWKAEIISKEQLAKSLPAKRERLRKMLGVVDEREPRRVEQFAPSPGSDHVHTIEGCDIKRVKWVVLPSIVVEGLYIEGAGNRRLGFAVAIPDSSQTPGQLAGFEGGDDFALRLARNGCDVFIPTAINRDDAFSANSRLNRATNLPHTEFVHRMAYEMGRTEVGLQVQTVLAVLMKEKHPNIPMGVIGRSGTAAGLPSTPQAARTTVSTFVKSRGRSAFRNHVGNGRSITTFGVSSRNSATSN